MLRSLPFAALAMTLPAQRLVAPLTRPEALKRCTNCRTVTA